MEVPCGQCIGCRLDYAQEWAIRCMHEASLSDNNAFITLTYRDSDLPQFGSLKKSHFQDFMKRLREHLAPKRIRFYHCGEYGEKYLRPHYHALIFGYSFPDRRLWSYGHAKMPLFRSALLEAKWPHGHSSIGELTKESAGYCARYSLKKVRGRALSERDKNTDLLPYQRINDFGEIIDVEPEYSTMSTHPAIGRDWYEQFKSDVFPDDFVVYKGKRVRTPKYYRKVLEVSDPELSADLRSARIRGANKHREDQTPERLAVRETCKIAQTSNLHRSYEANK